MPAPTLMSRQPDRPNFGSVITGIGCTTHYLSIKTTTQQHLHTPLTPFIHALAACSWFARGTGCLCSRQFIQPIQVTQTLIGHFRSPLVCGCNGSWRERIQCLIRKSSNKQAVRRRSQVKLTLVATTMSVIIVVIYRPLCCSAHTLTRFACKSTRRVAKFWQPKH